MAARLLRWETLTKKQFDQLDRERTLVVVTCSPLEVHGPHLPLGADALEGEGLAERMLSLLPERHQQLTFLKLPFVYVASDPVPQPGSLAFRPSTTIAVLEDLGRSLAAQGFRDVLVSNFHGSPRHFLSIEVASDRVSRERGIRMLCVFSALLTRPPPRARSWATCSAAWRGVEKADFDGDTHGGLVETSQLLALHPEWVDPGFGAAAPQRRSLAGGAGREAARGAAREIASLGKMLAGFKRRDPSSRRKPTAARRRRRPRSSASASSTRSRVTAQSWWLSSSTARELKETEWHSPVWKLRHLFVNPAAVPGRRPAAGAAHGALRGYACAPRSPSSRCCWPAAASSAICSRSESQKILAQQSFIGGTVAAADGADTWMVVMVARSPATRTGARCATPSAAERTRRSRQIPRCGPPSSGSPEVPAREPHRAQAPGCWYTGSLPDAMASAPSGPEPRSALPRTSPPSRRCIRIGCSSSRRASVSTDSSS